MTPPPTQRQQAAQRLLDQLESTALEVVLVPQKTYTNHGGMIRVALSVNCDWYRRLCLRHPSSRARRNLAPDTAIKRAQVVRCLRAIIAGRRPCTVYALRLAPFIKQEIATAAAPSRERSFSATFEPAHAWDNPFAATA